MAGEARRDYPPLSPAQQAVPPQAAGPVGSYPDYTNEAEKTHNLAPNVYTY